jgi:hypothetical protein
MYRGGGAIIKDEVWGTAEVRDPKEWDTEERDAEWNGEGEGVGEGAVESCGVCWLGREKDLMDDGDDDLRLRCTLRQAREDTTCEPWR